jgi:hypothetical protein
VIQFFIAFETEERAIEAASILDGRGFETAVHRGDEASLWTLSAVPRESKIDVRKTSRMLKEVSRSLDGDYVGHGGMLTWAEEAVID